MGSFSLVHWVVVVVILLLVFGPKRLSEVGKGLGQGIRNFKKGMEGGDGAEGDDKGEDPKRLKQAEAPKKLEGKKKKATPEPEPEDADDEDEDEHEDEPEEEEVRPRKKSKRT